MPSNSNVVGLASASKRESRRGLKSWVSVCILVYLALWAFTYLTGRSSLDEFVKREAYKKVLEYPQVTSIEHAKLVQGTDADLPKPPWYFSGNFQSLAPFICRFDFAFVDGGKPSHGTGQTLYAFTFFGRFKFFHEVTHWVRY